MTSASLPLLVALTALTVAVGIVIWMLHSRATARKHALEKAAETASRRAQERARIAHEIDQRHIASEEREVELARVATRRAKLDRRREELLTSGIVDKRVGQVAAPQPKNQSQHGAQPSEVRAPMASEERARTAVVRDPIVTAPDDTAMDMDKTIEVAADAARPNKGAAGEIAPQTESVSAKQALSLPETSVVSSKPLDAMGGAAPFPDMAYVHTTPLDEPVATVLHLQLQLQVGTQPVQETPGPITLELPALETVDEHLSAPADPGEVPRALGHVGAVESVGAFGEEFRGTNYSPAGAEHLQASAEELSASVSSEGVAANATSGADESHATIDTQTRDSFGLEPALRDDSSKVLEGDIGGLEDLVSVVQTTPAALDADPHANSGSAKEPTATDERLINQALAEEASPPTAPSVTPPTVDVKKLVDAQVPSEETHGEESDAATETDTDWKPSTTAAKQQRQYQPAARNPAKVRLPASREAAGSRDRGCAVDVRVQFAKGGLCRVSLLPRRAEGMPPNLCVSDLGAPLDFFEMQDDWYEDVVTPRLADLLTQGVAWESATSEGQRYSWALGGRAVWVLSAQPQISGYLNTQRLTLNEKHVVLCLATRKDEVLAAIEKTGATVPVVLGSGSGVPENWVALRDVVPRLPVQGSQDHDILDCLRPLPEAQLSLVGGIRLEGNSWLVGFPPQIRVRGDHLSVTSLFIDGHEANLDATGAFVANGWDAIGEHVVAASIGTRSYAIEREREDWQPWIAHAWSLGEEISADEFQRPSICGAMVQAPRAAMAAGRAIVVPESNAILIGEVPGEIEICKPHSESLNKLVIGFPNFEPVWAIPASALRCDKRTTRVLYLRTDINTIVQTLPAKAQQRSAPGRKQDQAQRAWSSAILAATRKGLVVSPHERLIVDLWKMYRERARALAKSSKA